MSQPSWFVRADKGKLEVRFGTRGKGHKDLCARLAACRPIDRPRRVLLLKIGKDTEVQRCAAALYFPTRIVFGLDLAGLPDLQDYPFRRDQALSEAPLSRPDGTQQPPSRQLPTPHRVPAARCNFPLNLCLIGRTSSRQPALDLSQARSSRTSTDRANGFTAQCAAFSNSLRRSVLTEDDRPVNPFQREHFEPHSS